MEALWIALTAIVALALGFQAGRGSTSESTRKAQEMLERERLRADRAETLLKRARAKLERERRRVGELEAMLEPDPANTPQAFRLYVEETRGRGARPTFGQWLRTTSVEALERLLEQDLLEEVVGGEGDGGEEEGRDEDAG